MATATTTKPDTSTLVEVIKRYERCVNASDAAGASELYTDDAVWMPPGGVDVQGREPIRQAETELFEQMRLSVELTAREARFLGPDAGLVRLVARGTAQPRGSLPELVCFSAVFVLHKHEGEWRISHKIWNHTPPG